MYPVLFDFGSIEVFGRTFPLVIGTWGVIVLIGVLCGWLIALYLGPKYYPQIPWTDVYFMAIIWGVVGGKLLNVMIHWPKFLDGRLSFSELMFSGGTWLGGLIAGIAWGVAVAIYYKVDYGLWANMWFVGIPLAHGIGRLACLFAGCCFGKECSWPWGITYTSEIAHQRMGTPLHVPLHPTPIYESGLQMVNFAICFWMFKRNAPGWSVMAAFFGLYGTERFFIEFFRADAMRGQFGIFSTSQWISLGMVAISIVMAVWIIRRERRIRSDEPKQEPSASAS